MYRALDNNVLGLQSSKEYYWTEAVIDDRIVMPCSVVVPFVGQFFFVK